MDKLTLVIGTKNYSSWSLRPWLALRHAGIPFEEVRIPLYRADSGPELTKWSPSGLVPALKHGTLTVWDSLAICEYLHECFPDQNLWPAEPQARAIARSVSAEMHAGFMALRSHMPMNCRLSFPGKGMSADSRKDIDRVLAIWRQCRTQYGAEGPMLFGGFSIADAMYAPVALRFVTYDVPLDTVAQQYVDAILSLPALQEWLDAARAEPERLEMFEPYA
jgi:glutathione S-transferase